jgi:tellurium resistance protein TerD
MSISLQKKEKISLTKGTPGLKNILVELTWSVDPTTIPKNAVNPKGLFDADLSAFVCETRNVKGQPTSQVIDDVFTCFFNNPQTADGAVVSLDGDDAGNDGDGKEEIAVDLSKLDKRASEIAFVATIDKGDVRHQSYGQITGGSIKAINQDTGDVLAEFKYGNSAYTTETAIQVASLVSDGNGGWEFHANGDGGVKTFIDIATQDFGFPA